MPAPPGSGRAPFLPLTLDEARRRGWSSLDVVLVTGDAYVDHPSFGMALIGRLLEARGLRVGVLSRPDWRSADAFRALGRPRLFFGVSSGNLDSLIANRNAWKAARRTDAYAPGGAPGGRPDRAALVYAQRCREAFPGVPILLGGLEASLRRLAHYDWWSNTVRRGLLLDARADLLIYGMGERAVLEAADRLSSGRTLSGIPGTVEALAPEAAPQGLALPAFEALASDLDAFLEAQRLLEKGLSAAGPVLLQAGGGPGRLLVHHPPPPPPAPAELDSWFGLPFLRKAHPDHEASGGVPALDLVADSIIAHRGCLGDCSFCALTLHQGRALVSRSPESIAAEAAALLADPALRGRISDVGGPSANMYGLACPRLAAGDPCPERSCLTPIPCPRLGPPGSRAWLELLERLAALPGAKSIGVGSGVRFDLLDRPGLERLLRHHVRGQLKVAPEHCGAETLERMNKPPWERYVAFERLFRETNRRLGLDLYLANYFLAAHPGTSLEEAVELFAELAARNYAPEQVQVFLPIPMTRAAAMFHTGRDPRGGAALPVARGDRERRMHLALVRWKDPASRPLVLEALKRTGRMDLARRLRG